MSSSRSLVFASLVVTSLASLTSLVACSGGLVVDLRDQDASVSDGSDFGQANGGVPYTPDIPKANGVVKPYDCSFIGGANCWKEVVDRGVACAPGPARVAKLASDRLACRYEDGARVVFAEPLPTGLNPNTVGIGIGTPYELRDSEGDVCLRVRRIANGTAVDSAAGTVAFQVLPGVAARVTCPDGSVYESASPVLDCPGVANVFNGRLPSLLWSTTSNGNYQGGFSGTASGALSVFTCTP